MTKKLKSALKLLKLEKNFEITTHETIQKIFCPTKLQNCSRKWKHGLAYTGMIFHLSQSSTAFSSNQKKRFG